MWRMTHMVGDERGRSGEVRPRAPWGRAGPASARTNVVESKATRGPLRQARILPAPTPRNDISILPPSLRLSPGALPRTRRRTGRGEAGPSLYSSRGGGGTTPSDIDHYCTSSGGDARDFRHNLPITRSQSSHHALTLSHRTLSNHAFPGSAYPTCAGPSGDLRRRRFM